VITRNDVSLSLPYLQPRLERDYYIKHLQRYNTYLNGAMRLILDVSGGNKEDVQRIDQIKLYLCNSTMHTKYKAATKSGFGQEHKINESHELTNINNLLKSNICRKEKMKKRKREIEQHLFQNVLTQGARSDGFSGFDSWKFRNFNKSVDGGIFDRNRRGDVDLPTRPG
jgi:hypothetical protein